MWRERAGDHSSAEALARHALDAGDPEALGRLALVRERAGDHMRAQAIRRFSLTADGDIAEPW